MTTLEEQVRLTTSSATPQNWRRILDGMRERGMTVDADGSSDATARVFEAKRRAFTVDCDRRDARYYRVSLLCVDCASPESRARKLRAANVANMSVKCAKVVVGANVVSVVAEQLIQTPEDFFASLDRVVDCCLRAEEIYLRFCDAGERLF